MLNSNFGIPIILIDFILSLLCIPVIYNSCLSLLDKGFDFCLNESMLTHLSWQGIGSPIVWSTITMVRRSRNSRPSSNFARRVKRPSVKESKTQAHIAHRGRVTNPSADPTSVSTKPWSQVVVTIIINNTTAAPTYTFTIGNLNAGLRTQLNLSSLTPSLEFRVFHVSSWELTGVSFALGTYSFVTRSSRYLSEVEDLPGRNRWAKTGFIWPASDQAHVWDSTSDAQVPILTLSSVAAASFVVHIMTLWRVSGTPLPSASVSFLRPVALQPIFRRESYQCKEPIRNFPPEVSPLCSCVECPTCLSAKSSFSLDDLKLPVSSDQVVVSSDCTVVSSFEEVKTEDLSSNSFEQALTCIRRLCLTPNQHRSLRDYALSSAPNNQEYF